MNRPRSQKSAKLITREVFEDSILFGQTAAFSGPAAALGIGMRDGILAAFEEKNRAGGVHNRQLLVKSLDDTYEPELAIENAQRLIDQDGVFALIGSVGTPTSRSTAPVALAAGVPLVGPFTGAAILRDASFRISSTCALRTRRKPKRWYNGSLANREIRASPLSIRMTRSDEPAMRACSAPWPDGTWSRFSVGLYTPQHNRC